jgi:hypothetical protein
LNGFGDVADVDILLGGEVGYGASEGFPVGILCILIDAYTSIRT